MSVAVRVGIDDPAPSVVPWLNRPRLRSVAVLASGVLLSIATLVFLGLLQRAHVPDAGHPEAWRVLVRLGSGFCLFVLGALLLAHVPRHPLAWILCLAGLGSALANAGLEYAIYSHLVAQLPAAEWAGWVAEWAAKPILLIPTVALLLFPDGRLPGRRWRPALWCGLSATVLIGLNGALGIGKDLAFQGNPFLSDAAARALGEPFGLGWLLVLPSSLAGIAAIAVRRRAAEGETREQLRLLGRAAVVVMLGFAACLVVSFAAPGAFDFGSVLAVSSLSVLAASMAVAILRHRLYGLDVYINRALVLTGVTLVLGTLYMAAVLLASSVLGQNVQLGVALPATALVAVAFQPVRNRLQRSVNRLLHGQRDEPYAALTTLGRRLGDTMDPRQVLPVMVQTIADALRLPYVAVTLADTDATPAAAHGTPAAGIALRLALTHAGQHVGTLIIGARAHGEALDSADRRLLEDFAHRASAAASAVALSVEIQHSRERLVTAREEERRRLRGDLHDGLGPTLAGAILTIDAARRSLTSDPQAADALLDRAAASVEGAVTDVRRVVYALRPPALDQLGVVGALRQQASTLTDGEPRLTCNINAPDPMPPLPAAVEVATYRIAQEALTNVVRHSRAQHAAVSIAVDEMLHLEIRDDGTGLPEHHNHGVGLTSMRERATELGGTININSAPGGGTLVNVTLPLP